MMRMEASIQPDVDVPLQAVCVDAGTALQRYGDGWRDLAANTEAATFFMWPAVFAGWLRELATGVVAQVIVVLRGTHLMGVLPVMRGTVWRGPAFVPRIDYAPFDRDLSPGGARAFAVRQVSSVVSWRATSLRPTLLCAEADRVAVIGAVTRALVGMAGVDQIVLPVVDGEQTVWMNALRAAGLQPWCHALQRQVLTLDRVQSFDNLVATQNAKFRQNVRRARAAGAEVGLNYTVHVGHDAVLPHLGCVAQLAADSWKGMGGTAEKRAIPYAGLQQRFFERVFRDATSGMTPVLVIGAVGDTPVTTTLCMQHGRTLTTLLTFRNAMHAAASPGMLGMAALIDYAAEQGLQTLDLNATQDWVRYMTDSHHMLVNVCAFRPTLRGRIYDVIARRRRGRDVT